jgi:hypothetical protein
MVFSSENDCRNPNPGHRTTISVVGTCVNATVTISVVPCAVATELLYVGGRYRVGVW